MSERSGTTPSVERDARVEQARIHVHGETRAWTKEDIEAFVTHAFPATWLEQARLRTLHIVSKRMADRASGATVIAKSTEEALQGGRTLSIALTEDDPDAETRSSPEALYDILAHEIIAEVSRRTRSPHEHGAFFTWGEELATSRPSGVDFIGRRVREDERETTQERRLRAEKICVLFGTRALRASRAINEVATDATAEQKRLHTLCVLIATGFTASESERGMQALEQALGNLSEGAMRAQKAIDVLKRRELDDEVQRAISGFPQEWKALTEHALESLEQETNRTPMIASGEMIHAHLETEPAVSREMSFVCTRWMELITEIDEARCRGTDPRYVSRKAKELRMQFAQLADSEKTASLAERIFDAIRPPLRVHED